MWPAADIDAWGLGSDCSIDERTWKSHFCYYRVIKSSLWRDKEYTKWSEVCRCGRSKEIDYKFIVEGSNFPKMRVHWFDQEGKLERTTGDK